MARYRQAPVYVGDVGVITTPTPKTPIPANFDASQFTYRQICNILVVCGVDVRDIIPINECIEHEVMIFLGSKELPEGFNFFEDVKYCKSCWQMFRFKEKQVYDD